MRVRTAAGVLLALIALTGVALVAGPPSGDEFGEFGFRGFKEFLSEMGNEVSEGPDLPASGTLMTFHDERSTREEAFEVLEWVAGGRRLVLLNPGTAFGSAPSPIAAQMRIQQRGIVGGGIKPQCVTRTTTGVDEIEADTSSGIGAIPIGTSCFPGVDSYFMVTLPHGRGEVMFLANDSPFRNGLLGRADNAILAAQLAGDGPVTFESAGAGTSNSSGQSFWGALPRGVQLVLLGAILAGLAFAFVRGRRLGLPLPEEPITPIPSGELVRASSVLLRSSGSRAHVARVISEGAASRLARTLGIDPASAKDNLPKLVHPNETARSDDLKRRLLNPVSDDDLLSLATDVEESTRNQEGAFK